MAPRETAKLQNYSSEKTALIDVSQKDVRN